MSLRVFTAIVLCTALGWAAGCGQAERPVRNASTDGTLRNDDADASDSTTTYATVSASDSPRLLAHDPTARPLPAPQSTSDQTSAVTLDESAERPREQTRETSLDQTPDQTPGRASRNDSNVALALAVEDDGTTAAQGSRRQANAAAPTARLPVFEGWPKPQVALVFTGRQNGYIEPCGCAGLANQKGGMSRRHSLLTDLRAKGWTLIPLDVGNQIKRFGRQSEIKFQMTYEALKKMDYQAIGLGPDDLRLSAGEIFAAISDQPCRFVSANTAVLDRDLLPRSLAIEANGKVVGVTAVLGDDYRNAIRSDEVIVQPAADGLAIAVKQLRAQKCDVHVLLVYGSLDEARRLAKMFPQFQIVATTGGAEEPAFEPEQVPGTSNWIVQTGAKGMYAGVIGLFDDPRKPMRFQRVPLDSRYQDSREMLQILAAYQDQLQQAGFEGLGLKPLAHPTGRRFVGSEACADCHTQAAKVWSESSHGHATTTLEKPGERSEIPRHFDPECLSCHVVGWEPQKHVPFQSGYLSLGKTTHLKHVGCENCHGPGSQHVDAESGAINLPNAAKNRLRLEMQLPLAKARDKCLECHDLDNSPDFQKVEAFAEYWKKIAHPGKD